MSKTKNENEAATSGPAFDPNDPSVHPELAARGSFEHLPLGRVAPRHDERTLRFAKYLDDAVALPEIPEAWDWTTAVESWPMYGNDRLGDCTIAAAAHLVQAWTTAAGAPVTLPDDEVEAAYIPGTGADDSGRFEVDVLNFWRHQGIAGRKIEAYAYVDAKNLDHVRAAIYLFGGVYAGIALPKTAQGQAVWDVTIGELVGDGEPNSWGGHAVPYVGYDANGLKTVTWGAVLGVTNAFHLAYCDELYVPLSLDFLKDGQTPAAFDVTALIRDLEAIGHDVQSSDVDSRVEELHAEADAPDEQEPGLTVEEIDETRQQLDAGAPGYYWEG